MDGTCAEGREVDLAPQLGGQSLEEGAVSRRDYDGEVSHAMARVLAYSVATGGNTGMPHVERLGIFVRAVIDFLTDPFC